MAYLPTVFTGRFDFHFTFTLILGWINDTQSIRLSILKKFPEIPPYPKGTNCSITSFYGWQLGPDLLPNLLRIQSHMMCVHDRFIIIQL
jgi:hypothetical protein